MILSIPDQERICRVIKNAVAGYPCTDEHWNAVRLVWAVRFAEIDNELDKLGFEIVRKKP